MSKYYPVNKTKLLTWLALSLTAISSTLSVCTSVSAQPRPVKAINNCSSAYSMIVTPDGTCYNLTYLNIVGSSRADLNAAKNLYRQALNLNAEMDKTTTFTYSAGRGRTMSNSYTNSVSQSEREARYQLAQDTYDNLKDQTNSNEKIEAAAFKVHTYVMTQLSGAFVDHHRANASLNASR